MTLQANQTTQPQLKESRHGYYQYDPVPTDAELTEYYAQKYYQEGQGSYEVSYRDEEIDYARVKASLIYRQLRRLRPQQETYSLLDVGCGEGWLMEQFHCQGSDVRGIDFSCYGLEKYHPHLVGQFQQGDLYELLRHGATDGERYDTVSLVNVVEHVRDPEQLLDDVRPLLSDGGVLVIVIPNDFSRLHDYLLDQRIIERPFWLGYPDHLSYFNKETMENLLSDKGFRTEAVIAENPIDLNLLNANSNYVRQPEKGKAVHLYRVAVDNFLYGIDPELLLDLYSNLGAMGVGRNLVFYASVERPS